MALIAVDLTPIRSGGENGGAKVFILELLKQFHTFAPHHHFLLLTATWNNKELSILDFSNMERLCILGKGAMSWPSVPSGRFSHRLMQRVKEKWGKLNRHNSLRKGDSSASSVDLLFCPFTAPTYAEKGMRVISVVYDLQHRDYPQFFTRNEIACRDAFLEDVGVHADRIICISDYVRKSAIKHLKVNPDKTHTVHICIQSRLSCSLNEQDVLKSLKSMGIGQHPYMFYPANFWPHKNHKMLFSAFEIFLSRNPEISMDLVLTGALDGQKDLMKDVSDMGLSERIHFLGFISSEQLAIVWQGCDFLVFPSLYEGFGIPVVEAMNYGKPVICSNTTSLPEVAGNAAIYFNPRIPDEIEKCMEKVVFDKKIRNEIVARGKSRSNEFSAVKMAQEYLKHFHAVMNER